MKDGLTVAVVPGSFDPITLGHLDIIKRAAQMYDTVYVAVMINDQKTYLFSIDERESIAREAVKELPNVYVISSTGMLWKLAKDLSADAIVKGYRNMTDYDYEMKMAEYNTAHNPASPTVLLEANKDLEDISSTAVRNMLSEGKSLKKYLPEDVERLIHKILSTR